MLLRESCQGPELEALVTTLDAQLGHWPDKVRKLDTVDDFLGPLGRIARHLKLGVRSHKNTGPVRAACRSRHVHGISHLTLTNNAVLALPSLFSSELVSGLRYLKIEGRKLGPEGLDPILSTSASTTLEVLKFRRCGVRDTDIERLCASEFLSQLKEIHLEDNPVTHVAAQMLLRSSMLPSLASFNFEMCHIDDTGARKLAATPELTRAQTLDVRCNRKLTLDGIRALLLSPYLVSLRELDLSPWLYFTPEPEFLFECIDDVACRDLECLVVENCGLLAQDMASLARSTAFGKLRHLSLARNSIGDAGLKEVLHSPHVPPLKTLDLCACELTASSCDMLAQSKHAESIELLVLSDNSICERGAHALAHIGLPALESLNLSCNPIGSKGSHPCSRLVR